MTQIMLRTAQDVAVRFEQLSHPVDVDMDACLLRQVVPQPLPCPDGERIAIVGWLMVKRFFERRNVRICDFAPASRLRFVGQSLDTLGKKTPMPCIDDRDTGRDGLSHIRNPMTLVQKMDRCGSSHNSMPLVLLDRFCKRFDLFVR
jgi:hypothetical protein